MNQRLTKPTKINVVTDKEPPTRFKVIVLGDASVGKSSIVDRFLSNKFEDQYNPTIAVDYKHKSIYVNKELTLHLNFWDFSGHPEFAEVRNEFYKEASMILLVFDLTLKRSLEGLDMWMREANDYGAGALPVFVAANKKDLISKRAVGENEGINWARSRSFPYFEVSALSGQNIEEMMNEALKKMRNLK